MSATTGDLLGITNVLMPSGFVVVAAPTPTPAPTPQYNAVPGIPRRRPSVREARGRGLVMVIGVGKPVRELAIAGELLITVTGIGILIRNWLWTVAVEPVARLVRESAITGLLPITAYAHGALLVSRVQPLIVAVIRTGAEAVLTLERLVREAPVVRAVSATILVAERMVASSIALFPAATATMRHEYAIGGRMPVRTGGEAVVTGFESDEQVALWVLGLPSELGS